ncbi:MAG: nucleotidyltransferase family protein [bacterium]|nr:nucleotidyltransferase family protein [bacterium]
MIGVILAGGRATRLGELTRLTPKVLVEIGGKSVLEHQLKLFKKHEITKVFILTGHLGEQIANFCSDGSRFGMDVECLQEEDAQGTAGALRVLRDKINEDFLVVSGDIILDFDMSSFITYHEEHSDAIATFVVQDAEYPQHSDLVHIEDKKIRVLFLRPHQKDVQLPDINIASLYILSPRFLDFIPDGQCSIENDILPLVLDAEEKVYAYHTKEYVRDMGTPDRLKDARDSFGS